MLSPTELPAMYPPRDNPDVPTVAEVLDQHHLFDSVAWWSVEGGRISVAKSDLLPAMVELA
jgi:hypothetical protein